MDVAHSNDPAASTALTPARYRECLAADAARLRAVAADRLAAPVPSCPDWSVDDLVRHVAQVYLHKVAAMQQGERPTNWPPDLDAEPTLALFDRSFAELSAEFDRHSPADSTWTFYPGDQTVAFWLRRMAQETAIHRIDAELAADAVTPVPADLATDGIDEVLRIMLTWGTNAYPDDPDTAALLRAGDGRSVCLDAGGTRFAVRATAAGVELTPGGTGEVTVRADPPTMLCWLWNRVPADAATIDGDRAPVDHLRQLLADATL
ncbi:maleylpyruvate isomerase family mycothiol-dependent enzyme [Actinocatenispora sera]|uniref:Maleylpyruvate isomerase family mycothiol-dependent enzyme n=1 Tax=Actinocatenispora sera TaxID=390989 RepID=A0A810KT49_9ACTN|nr:maleylpyruvate isomerase family mycothiol-dependent enzyme [Actinocatenispora sera]BCJ26270.1 hypothetical protein Asera_03780 [Actinocatenispora sera]